MPPDLVSRAFTAAWLQLTIAWLSQHLGKSEKVLPWFLTMTDPSMVRRYSLCVVFRSYLFPFLDIVMRFGSFSFISYLSIYLFIHLFICLSSRQSLRDRARNFSESPTRPNTTASHSLKVSLLEFQSMFIESSLRK